MAKMVKKSPAPLYLTAAVWLLWGWFLPLYRWSDILLAAGVSAVVFAVGKLIFQDQIYDTVGEAISGVSEKQGGDTAATGNPEIDALLSERDKAISEIRRLNESIHGEKISAQIDHLEEMTRKITSHVAEHPEKLPQIRKFMNYYLPTTIKLLNAYDRMDDAGVAGANIDGTKGKIEAMMEVIVSAFDKQMDALFADEALDIATDITVMENLLTQEGLGSQSAGGLS